MSARCRGAVLYLARGVQLLVAAQRRVVADQETPARRREDALAAVEEAVEIRRELARERPDAFRPDMAMSLNNVSGRLSELGRREKALAAIEEAVEVYWELAGERPDAFRPDLATSLNNLSLELGRWEEAPAAIEGAVAIRRQLAARWLAAFQPALARSLLNRADILDRLQRTAEADASRARAAKLVERGDACRGDGDHGRLPTDASSPVRPAGARRARYAPIRQALRDQVA